MIKYVFIFLKIKIFRLYLFIYLFYLRIEKTNLLENYTLSIFLKKNNTVQTVEKDEFTKYLNEETLPALEKHNSFEW